jgi:uncharacterized membrane protein
MSGADNSRFAEILDDIEEALSAQEVLQGLLENQMVAVGVRKQNGWQSILNWGVSGSDNRAT